MKDDPRCSQQKIYYQVGPPLQYSSYNILREIMGPDLSKCVSLPVEQFSQQQQKLGGDDGDANYFPRFASPTTEEFVEGGSATAIVGRDTLVGADEETKGLLANRTKI